MSLQGFIGKLQNTCTRMYLDLAKSFVENVLFRETLVSLAHGKEEQAKCLKALPARYWGRHKKEEALFAAVKACLVQRTSPESETETSMQRTLSRVFDFEEPVILRVYAPLIRHLRTEWTDHTLDFYILTKAHVVRLARLAQSFSGNPVLIQRSMTLLEGFERAVQAPDLSLLQERRHVPLKKSAKKPTAAKSKPAGKKRTLRLAGRKKKHSPKTHPMGNRAKIISKPAKRLLKKLSIARRRARP